MKLLIMLVAALAVVWWWRRGRSVNSAGQVKPPPGPPRGAPQDMLQCAVCDVHLPRADTLFGPDGKPYCSVEHRRLRNGA